MAGKEGGNHSKSPVSWECRFTFSLGKHTAPAFTLVLPPPDLLKAPPGLVTAGWAETNQEKNDLLQYA